MEEKELKGAFADSLKRNYKQIREDRASAIVEVAHLKYKRKIEDLEMELNDMRREQDNMIDLSPTTTTSLTVPSDFKADEYIAKDLELGIRIRTTEIKLDVAKKRFAYLFGE